MHQKHRPLAMWPLRSRGLDKHVLKRYARYWVCRVFDYTDWAARIRYLFTLDQTISCRRHVIVRL